MVVSTGKGMETVERTVVMSVETSNGRQEIGGILYRTSDRAYRVLVLTDRNDEVSRGQTEGRLHANDVVDIRGTNNGAVCLSTKCCPNGTHRSGNTTARGRALRILVWVVCAFIEVLEYGTIALLNETHHEFVHHKHSSHCYSSSGTVSTTSKYTVLDHKSRKARGECRKDCAQTHDMR
jgi:hypothetical protein